MLTTEEILRKVRELEIRSKKITANLFTGEYHAAFKGKGMHFREVKEYSAGDDVRFIDWNVSARFNHTFTKVFEEERELTVMLLIDTSGSNLFGSGLSLKVDLVQEVAALLVFSAINNNDKVGAIFFSDKVNLYIPPKQGRQHALYIVRKLVSADEDGMNSKTNINDAIKYFNQNIKQRSIAFLLSDFIDTGFDNDLKIIGKKHDVIGVKIYDKMDMELPDAGLIQFEDAETGVHKLIDSSNAAVRFNYKKQFIDHSELTKKYFRKAGSDLLHISTSEDPVKILQQFFLKRK